jgi:deoxyribonuclease-1
MKKWEKNTPVWKIVGVVIILCLLLNAAGFGIKIADAKDMPANWSSAKRVFWNEIYPSGGTTFYCGKLFVGKSEIDMEHVFPRSWAMESLGCKDGLTECRKNFPIFKLFESDLYNLYPAHRSTNRSRSNLPFNIIAGEEHRFSNCDFDRVSGVVEPRPAIRGQIARTLFYVRDAYGFKIKGDVALLEQWAEEYPVSCSELSRSYKILEATKENDKWML